MSELAVRGLIGGYASPTPAALDEFIDEKGSVREHWVEIAAGLDRLTPPELQRRRDEIRRLLDQNGVTYNTTTGGRRRHQPWNLDAVPLVLPSSEWQQLERGIIQRAELLNLVLDDLYGDRRLLQDRAIPLAIIFGDPQFLRECQGIRLPGPNQLVTNATDLARTSDRGWVAIGQRSQAPSGAAYALENRRVLARVFPALFRRAQVQRIEPFVRALGHALRTVAPDETEDPGIVMLSPGPMSETSFEHASLAAQLGYPLVEAADLHVRDGKVWLRTVGRLRRVHVILRRVDSWFSDPLELRSDSTLGVAGLVDACRTGAVSVVNTLGSGVLENAALQAMLPQLSERLLGEDLILPPAQAWWCGTTVDRSHVVSNLGEIIVRPLSRHSLGSSIDTRRSSESELKELRDRIEARPEQWVGQEILEPATSPVLGSEGFGGRGTVLRTFTVASDGSYVAMPGGLARAAALDNLPIATRMGALAKDVWVVGGEEPADALDAPIRPSSILVGATVPAARAAENLFWLGRYAERAEATVRALREVDARRNDFQDLPGGPGAAALTALFEMLTRVSGTFPGFVGDDAIELRREPHVEMLSLLTDSDRPGTVGHAIVHMFDAIDVLRDQLSSDTWLVVSSLQNELEQLDRGEHVDGADDFTRVINDLLEGLLALAGVSGESTQRDQAWHFTECGRRIERALQIMALLSMTLTTERGAAAENILLESVLATGESIITYRRRYRASAQVVNVLELLIHDPDNPRSVAYQLVALRRSLPALDPEESVPHAEQAHRIIDDLTALVELADASVLAHADAGGHRRVLDDFGQGVRSGLRDLSELIGRNYFSHLQPQRSVVTPVDPSRP